MIVNISFEPYFITCFSLTLDKLCPESVDFLCVCCVCYCIYDKVKCRLPSGDQYQTLSRFSTVAFLIDELMLWGDTDPFSEVVMHSAAANTRMTTGHNDWQMSISFGQGNPNYCALWGCLSASSFAQWSILSTTEWDACNKWYIYIYIIHRLT